MHCDMLKIQDGGDIVEKLNSLYKTQLQSFSGFIKEKQRYKLLKTAKWISVLLLVTGPLSTFR